MRTAPWIVVLSLILAGCGRSPHPSQPTVRFFDAPTDLGDTGWMEEQADRGGVRLDLSGLHAIDGRVAFLFGGLSVPAGMLRSVVLRTADGGATWQEAMSPVPGSSVLYVAFADSEHGWALAAWMVEGPGDVVLYRSVNAGRTWTKLGDVPRSTWSYPVSMAFTDPSHGEIGMTYGSDDADPVVPAGVELLATSDGGRTWRSARRVPADEDPDEEPPTLLTSTGRDGSSWQLDLGPLANPHAVVRRRPPAQDDWTPETTLPTRFNYGAGRVLAPRDP